ncbi:MAG: hypothetical protein QNK82_15550 [Akkermansiaceae bacterium]
MPLGRVLLTLLATTLLVAASTQTFFKEHCVKCHCPKMQKGDLRLDTLARDLRKCRDHRSDLESYLWISYFLFHRL